MTDGAIAVFVKTPGHSPLKTRLAAECGAAYAQAWYERACIAVGAVVRGAQIELGLRAYWAVAEDDALESDCWRGLPVISQGAGGLGERMSHVHARLVSEHRSGMLIGADAPQVTVELIAQAADWLRAPEPRLALGPASDGGFWLFGGNVVLPLPAWTATRYSTPQTADEFRASLGGYGRWCTLPTLTDADHRGDLRAVLDALRSLPRPLPEQRALAEWMLEHRDALA
ncbi:TIGR04282 family arsenosugar biosynthesis glycosyltransferase [Cognatilysobacter bugurensis]|uniref:DUF2064 domain-containing protein n=1 Tax=Cognatilysobacter bugurensis TaxID=543356 RepID=A0A918W9C7_9GAMM|nr:DUF2064 domain-containing protein [Lysobacter bugurensis]GHA80679.1 hypothetical protein GCM10007067_18240 [Lysobacter bugurensis]